MILELAEVYVQDGTGSDFEASVHESAERYISKTPGFISYELRRSMEDPTRYMLIIQWETLEAHTVNFRTGPDFAKHRKLISPYFAKPPLVHHFELCRR